MKAFLYKRNELLLSIGEDGLTALYIVSDIVRKRMFCKTVQEDDITELVDIFQKDKNVKVTVYLDHQFQEYSQSTVPGVNAVSASKIAQKRANSNSKGNRYQIAHEVYRTVTGRRDWIYLFTDIDFQGKVNIWLDFLYQNTDYISAIYVLPLESYELIKGIRYYKEGSQNKQSSKPYLHKSYLKLLKRENKLRWDILVTSNKSGGLRITAFFNHNAVFSRLIGQYKRVEDFDAEASIILQEINNSLEYLRRLNYSIHSIAESRVYIVTSNAVKARCDLQSLETKNVEIYTPYDLANILSLQRNLVKEQDRFCDPILIYAAHKKLLKHSSIIPKNYAKKFRVNKIIVYFVKLIQYSIPILFFLIIFFGLRTGHFALQHTILSGDLKDLGEVLSSQIELKKAQEEKFSGGLKSKHINEIIKLYNELEDHNIPILQLISEFSKLNEDFIRIKRLRWRIDSSRLRDQVKKDRAGNLRKRTFIDSLRYFMDATLVLYMPNQSYDEALERYTNYTRNVQDFFECCTVRFKMTDKDFTFQEIGKPIEVRLFVEYDEKPNTPAQTRDTSGRIVSNQQENGAVK